jgi:cytidylate kinase
MTVSSFLHRHAEALEHLMGYRFDLESPDDQAARTAVDSFTIALSREAGTPAREVAQAVADRLGWTVHDREVAARIAEQLHVPTAAIEAIDERRHSWLLECIEAFGSRSAVSESRYFRCLISVLRSLGEEGRCAIVGHGAAFVLPSRSTLRVRLVGDRAHRIAAFARAFHLDRGTAARQVDEVNRERNRFIREHFHVDPCDADHYDLVLNTSQWSPADCADFIVEALHHKANGHQPR